MGEITPYGAVFGESNLPSAMESYDYFQQKKQREKLTDIEQRKLALKEKQDADENFIKALKPVMDFKSTTGFSSVTPDAIVTNDAKALQVEASSMYKEGKSPTEVALFINDGMQKINLKHGWFKGAQEQLSKEIGTIDKSGLDVNRIKQLGEAYILQNMKPGEQVAGILPKILDHYGDAIPVNSSAAFNIKSDEPFSMEYKSVKSGDGTVSSGVANTKYNPLYQEVSMDKDKSVSVQTKKVPAMVNGKQATDVEGNPVFVLPEEAYHDFVNSNPARMVEVAKLTKKLKADQEQKLESWANKQTESVIKSQYPDSEWLKIPFAKRQKIREGIKKSQLDGSVAIPDDEVIRQQAAYQLADKYVPKNQVGINKVKDPTIVINNKGNGKYGNGDTEFYDGYTDLMAATEDGMENPFLKGSKAIPLEDQGEFIVPIVDFVSKSGYKKSDGLTTSPYNASDINVFSYNGKLYAAFGSGESIEIPKAYLNKKLNPGDRKTINAINNGATYGAKDIISLRKRFNYGEIN